MPSTLSESERGQEGVGQGSGVREGGGGAKKRSMYNFKMENMPYKFQNIRSLSLTLTLSLSLSLFVCLSVCLSLSLSYPPTNLNDNIAQSRLQWGGYGRCDKPR